MGHHDRIKAADTYHSIHPYIFIASCKNVPKKRELERLQIHIRVYYAENVTIRRGSQFFGNFQNSVILSLQMQELWLIHLFKANILTFLYIFSN